MMYTLVCVGYMNAYLYTKIVLIGQTHTTYCKTLQNALGMKTVNANVFYETIGKMYPVVKAMVDEVAKREKNVTVHA